MQRCGTSRTTSLLTLVGAEQILPASPQQAGESGHAGRDLPLQQRTNSGADLQQVVGADVSAQFHLVTRTDLAQLVVRLMTKTFNNVSVTFFVAQPSVKGKPPFKD